MDALEVFRKNLANGNREACLSVCMELLASGKAGIKDLYEEYLKPALQACDSAEEALCAWKEHMADAIVRAVVECAYPYVRRERDARVVHHKIKAAVLSPEGEHREADARIMADYLFILGYDVFFVGSNMPKTEVLKAVQALDIDLLAVHVTSFYNLVAAKKLADLVHSKAGRKVWIIAGGEAFETNAGACTLVGADRLVHSFEDMESVESLLI